MRILRDMARDQKFLGQFDYALFRQRLSAEKLIKGQEAPLEMRLQLLESFLTPSGLKFRRQRRTLIEDEKGIWDFKAGTLTIVDLSCPFVDQNDACTMFNICLSIFLERRDKCGRLIALDEAHKVNSRTLSHFAN